MNAEGKTSLAARFKGMLGPAGAAQDGKLGTFLGVFTPSILTILGVILYLRTGWVVGNVGLVSALAIVAIANAITISTAMSVSSVATNMRVGAGGAYYIISRSLGIEIGAAIGLPLFLAQAFSVTLYAYGLAESLQLVWPQLPQGPIAAVVVLLVTLLAARSASLALKMQIPIMAAIGVSLVVLGIGVLRTGFVRAGESLRGIEGGEPFWVVFAVFFPAVTGIMAGISLSGDLREPAKSIPRGTMAAVLAGTVVYLLVPIGLAVSATPQQLVDDSMIWFSISGAIGVLIFPGLWGAIFSSAVGSALGAPRTLEALASDGVLPRFLAGKRGSDKEGSSVGFPLLISTAISLGAVGLGGLNAVAPVLTMFFLTTYGMVNLVAGLERLSGDPSYRPTVRTPWIISLAAAAACLWVMFLINRWACLVAILVEIGVYALMTRRRMSASWGDMRRGVLVALVRSTVIRLRNLPEDPRNWRPHILLFAGDVKRRRELVRYAGWLNQNRGILTVGQLLPGTIEQHAASLAERKQELERELDAMGVLAFGEVDIVQDLEEGSLAIAQGNGMAGIQSNTVMFGWSEKRERMEMMLRIVGRLTLLGKSSVICRTVPRPAYRDFDRIDVWWGGLQRNGDLLLMFAHLMSLNPEWRRARIRIKSIATTEMMYEQTSRMLNQMLDRVRIDAEPEVIRKPPDDNVLSVIHDESEDADAVFMGLRAIQPGEEGAYLDRLRELVEGLPTTFLVRNAGIFAGELLGDAAPEVEETGVVSESE